MSSIKKSTKTAIANGRETAVRVGKVAKSAAVAGAKAGAAAALAAGALEAQKAWKDSSPAEKKRTRNGVAALLAGTAVIGVAAVAINSRRKRAQS